VSTERPRHSQERNDARQSVRKSNPVDFAPPASRYRPHYPVNRDRFAPFSGLPIEFD
jgi:hypothetical protein